MCAPCAFGASIRATPSVRGEGVGVAPSSVCPEYSSCSPDESLSRPDCSHLVSLSPSTPILLLGCFFSCLVHRPDVPCGYSRCCPGCQKGSQPCSFLSAFTAPRHKSPRWRPFLAQVNIFVCCRRCFCNTILLARWSCLSRLLRHAWQGSGSILCPSHRAKAQSIRVTYLYTDQAVNTLGSGHICML